MNRYLRISIIAGLATGLFGITEHGVMATGKLPVKQTGKKDTVVGIKMEKPVPSKEILFFMNPNGHPCQMQNAILEEIKDSLATLAKVTYIKTTEPKDRDAFETYGIRGLPSLIIVDKNKKELKRFTPGIQRKEDILAALREKVK
jgi:thiol-disulfide isomerase/thioredoxin